MEDNLVILIVPPSDTFRQPEEDLGLGYLSAVLNEKGIDCEIIDGFLSSIETEEIKNEILVRKPKIVGFTLYQDSLDSFSEIAKFIKLKVPSAHIAIGGFLASFNYEWIFSSFPGLVDSIIIGEGEVTFSELAEKLIAKEDWKKTAGLIFEGSEKPSILKNREKINNLDLLPFPDRPTIRETIAQKNPVHISCSRGCYGDCSFCSVNSFGRLNSGEKWRGRSIKNIVDEIEEVSLNYGATYFKFVDDCFFPPDDKGKRAEELCKELNKRKLKINFRMSCRADDVDKKTFRLLRDHGLFSVSLGVESIIPRQLKEWRKGTTPKQNISAVEICSELGIIVQMGYIMLDKDSTIEELKLHLNFLQKYDYVITKGIYSCVFAAEGTDLTEEYIKGTNVKKKGINLEYRFKSKAVSEIASALKKWNKSYGDIYHWAIDSLSAPKAISGQEREEIHKTVMLLKRKELFLLESLIQLYEKGDIDLVDSYINQKIIENRSFFTSVKNDLVDFYEKANLPYKKGINPYL